jgi:hypothetical protein
MTLAHEGDYMPSAWPATRPIPLERRQMMLDISDTEYAALGPGMVEAMSGWLWYLTALFDRLHAVTPYRLSHTPSGALRSLLTRLTELHEAIEADLTRRGPFAVNETLADQLATRADKASHAGDDWTETSGELSDCIDAVAVHIHIAPVFLRQTPPTFLRIAADIIVDLCRQIGVALTDRVDSDTSNVELRITARSDQVKASVRHDLRLLGV